ncbi:iron dicitrate ABC transporter ATP-binding protein [Klebsiella pneumoniae]|nr:iron dicitrate ABC transporter ATP-binding protein [Klebsiella pneumoniae]
MPVNDEHARKKYHQRQGKGNHSQPVDEETTLFLGDRTVSQAAWQPGAMVRLTVSGKARVFSGETLSRRRPAIAGAAQKANQAEDEADSIRATDLVAMEW